LIKVTPEYDLGDMMVNPNNSADAPPLNYCEGHNVDSRRSSWWILPLALVSFMTLMGLGIGLFYKESVVQKKFFGKLQAVRATVYFGVGGARLV
jgi:hypothetical protein